MKMSDIVVEYFDKIFEKYSLTLKEFINFFENPEFDFEVSEVKKEIKAFHIFDDQKGYNVLFITSDDKVFGFGSNCFGCCGLGHNSVVNEPQIIPELCHKNIKQFFIGYDFVLAQSFDNHLYGWGKNNCGQLGRGYIGDDTECLKPDNVESNKLFIEISCGSQHCLALGSNGLVYGWGANNYGQVGCGKDKDNKISKPIRLEKFGRNSIKHIYCSFGQSYALTFDGLVYSWGLNDWCSLGHELSRDESVFEPKLINISNVISLSISTDKTHFLTNVGNIYFCGKNEDKFDDIFQKTPKLQSKRREIIQLHFIPVYRKLESVAFASEKINWNDQDFKTTNQWYYANCKMTYNTLVMDRKKRLFLSESKLYEQDNEYEKCAKSFQNRFVNLDKILDGGFGSVVKVMGLSTQTIFAIKKIYLRGK